MRKVSLLLVCSMLFLILSGCTVTVGGKKIISFNEKNENSINWSSENDGEGIEKKEIKKQEISSEDKINISNSRGEIVIKSWDKNYVQVTAVKKIKDQNKNDIKVNVNSSSDTVNIDVKYPTGIGINKYKADLEVMVPNNIKTVNGNSTSGKIRASEFDNLEKIDIESVSGDIDINKVTSKNFDIESTSGKVEMDVIVGNSFIKTVSGSVDVKEITGDLVCETLSGDVKVNSLNGEVNAESISGELDIRSKYLKQSNYKSTSGNIKVTAEGIEDSGKYSFESVSGKIKIELPENAEFTLDAKSTSGNINNSFMIDKYEENSKKHIRGSIGSGKTSITVSTISGNIEIDKK